jgi:hypothetical protein
MWHFYYTNLVNFAYLQMTPACKDYTPLKLRSLSIDTGSNEQQDVIKGS